ncbi:MAG: GlsB/YeaQ/YmgE family stress response membrane protein [Leptonema illini]|mgnify:CR=1 FL=1|uniref:Transglycosylase-associated protein n=3 Tax=Leptonema illini TaxID=183 RepID=H2CA25_9LEPT|nr:GlsB/YeaQ/YmgE family stress response membrane protein [Leptonema illini]EHQ05149.1 Transglycosylase-associated protein [Leptonema illini DSM 21528]KAB2930594.1 MAG: GlsB/YeaQ/YmgE family stress response membrane protein [Leptonema illini]
MGFFAWIIMGLLAGIVAKLLMPGKDPGGWIITILLGIAGAFVGGYIGSLLGFGGLTGFSLKSFLLAVGGAVILLFAYRLIKK